MESYNRQGLKAALDAAREKAVKSDYPVDGIARSISSDKPQSVGCYFAFSVIQISQTKKRHLNPILSFPILRYYQT